MKSKRSVQSVSPQSVMQLASELDVIVPTLNPSAPMPLNFREAWVSAKDELERVMVWNQNDSNSKVAKALNRRGLLTNKFLSWFTSEKRMNVFIVVTSSVFTVFGAVSFPLILSAAEIATLGSLGSFCAFLGGIPLGFSLSVPPVMSVGSAVEYKNEKLFSPLVTKFDSGYEQCVSQWAQARYSVTIPAGAWAGPTDRVSKDIVYLGVKDGEGVYCQQHEEGWILTYKDGTELPVLVGQKELVEA